MSFRCLAPLALLLTLVAGRASAAPLTISFTAGDARQIMDAAYGDPLHDDLFQWGLWSIRAMPIVEGGTWSITSTTVDGTGADQGWQARRSQEEYAWPYYRDMALFFATPGTSHTGGTARQVSFIADQPTSTFQSYAFGVPSTQYPGLNDYVAVCTDNPTVPGCTETRVLSDWTVFTFSYLLSDDAVWRGWQFLVDGSQYYRPGPNAPENRWVMDFNGGNVPLPLDPYRQTTLGGGLDVNVGQGYQVLNRIPEPGTLSLVGLGALGAGLLLVPYARRRTAAVAVKPTAAAD